MLRTDATTRGDIRIHRIVRGRLESIACTWSAVTSHKLSTNPSLIRLPSLLPSFISRMLISLKTNQHANHGARSLPPSPSFYLSVPSSPSGGIRGSGFLPKMSFSTISSTSKCSPLSPVAPPPSQSRFEAEKATPHQNARTAGSSCTSAISRAERVPRVRCSITAITDVHTLLAHLLILSRTLDESR